MHILNERNLKNILSALAIVLLASAFCYASGGEGGHGEHGVTKAQWVDLGWRVLNFFLLAGILIWGIKKANMKAALADRQAAIEKNLSDARTARESAEVKLNEYVEKLAKANQEVDELRAAMIKEAEAEQKRIIAEAQSAAEKVAIQAAQAAEQEILKARTELRAEAARLAVGLATGKLSGAVQKADHDRFVEDYLGKVGQL